MHDVKSNTRQSDWCSYEVEKKLNPNLQIPFSNIAKKNVVHFQCRNRGMTSSPTG